MPAHQDSDLYRRLAVALCEYACGPNGRDKNDPVYVEVTEGRDGPGPEQRRHYSSCADLAHWMLQRLGVTASWVNRKPSWRAGKNVSLLAWNLWAKQDGFDGAWRPKPGDILIIWSLPDTSDAHVCVCLAEPKDGHIRTANYGAGGMSAAVSPGCRISDSPLRWDGRHWILGKREVHRHISISDVLSLITRKADIRGAELTGEDIDAIDLHQ